MKSTFRKKLSVLSCALITLTSAQPEALAVRPDAKMVSTFNQDTRNSLYHFFHNGKDGLGEFVKTDEKKNMINQNLPKLKNEKWDDIPDDFWDTLQAYAASLTNKHGKQKWLATVRKLKLKQSNKEAGNAKNITPTEKPSTPPIQKHVTNAIPVRSPGLSPTNSNHSGGEHSTENSNPKDASSGGKLIVCSVVGTIAIAAAGGGVAYWKYGRLTRSRSTPSLTRTPRI